MASVGSRAQEVGSYQWLMNTMNNYVQQASQHDVFYCNNGSMLIIPKLGALCTYIEKDYSDLFQIDLVRLNGTNVYKAKYGSILLYPVNAGNSNNATAIIATWVGSNQQLTFNRIPENQEQAYRQQRCATTNSDFANVVKATAQIGYAVNSGINCNNYANTVESAGSYDSSSGLYRKTCTLCGGDGLSPQRNYTHHYGYGADKVYCDKCRTSADRHWHPQCPGCRGKGYNMLAR